MSWCPELVSEEFVVWSNLNVYIWLTQQGKYRRRTSYLQGPVTCLIQSSGRWSHIPVQFLVSFLLFSLVERTLTFLGRAYIFGVIYYMYHCGFLLFYLVAISFLYYINYLSLKYPKTKMRIKLGKIYKYSECIKLEFQKVHNSQQSCQQNDDWLFI